jgi:multimeric flavodoxin WrbA
VKILAVNGSPRRGGNTDLLLGELVRGAREAGAEVEVIFLRELKMSPCLEIYACKDTGECPIQDDMRPLYPKLTEADALVVASPIFFYGVTAHLKAFIDRCQAMWARKYILKQTLAPGKTERRGVFLAIGGSKGSRIFEGVLLTMKYFFDALDIVFYKSLLYRSVDAKGQILDHPTALPEAYALGKELAQS